MLIKIYAINFFLNFFFISESKEKICSLGGAQFKRVENEETRAQIKKILKVDFMSSDEESEDGFITHPLLGKVIPLPS